MFELRRPVSNKCCTECFIFYLSQSILVDFSEELCHPSDIGKELGKGVEFARDVTERNKSRSLKDCLA